MLTIVFFLCLLRLILNSDYKVGLDYCSVVLPTLFVYLYYYTILIKIGYKLLPVNLITGNNLY